MDLNHWLERLEQLSPPDHIDLGLERLRSVWQRLHPEKSPLAKAVISVAGTNGKGSSVALLEHIYYQAGYRVFSYTSPHLFRYNERFQFNTQPVADQYICRAFEQIAQVATHDLTYFEWSTLAALLIARIVQPDILILEVGLGGRLDAVNLIDADLALLTSIGLDHQDYLGSDRESIAAEKAGIMRPYRPVVFAEKNMPQTIADIAQQCKARLYRAGYDYDWQALADHWLWTGQDQFELPYPALNGQHQLANAAAVIQSIDCLPFPVSLTAIKKGLLSVQLAGRLQWLNIEGQNCLCDVAHNLEAVQCLSDYLSTVPGTKSALFAALKDKPIDKISAMMDVHLQDWHLVPLPTKRALKPAVLAQKMAVKKTVYSHVSMDKAWQSVRGKADTVLIFGSFYTINRFKLVCMKKSRL